MTIPTRMTTARQFARRARAAAAVAVCLLLALAAAPAPAAPAPAGAVLFGSVDTQKILAGYTKKAALDQQIQQLSQRLDAQFKQQVSSAMLSKAQQAQLGALISKPSPTDADRAQITALQAQSTKDSQELAALQQKQNPTDADKARLEALTKQQQAGQQALQEVAKGYQDQVQAENERLSGQLSESVKAAIVAVAKERGLAVVFDSQVAIYTANDITEDVLKRLNK